VRDAYSSPVERLVYADEGITKSDVLEYYRAVAHRLLPELVNRPLSILRAPQGVGHKTFFQKHHNPSLGAHIHSIELAQKNRTEPYIYIDDERGLFQLIQLNALEFHPWGSRSDQPEQPDRLIFDLDPGDCVQFSEIVEAAHTVRRELTRLRLKAFVRSSGRQGLHVIAPITPGPSWTEVKDFCEAFATVMAKREPNRYVASLSKARRRGRVFVDWLRNMRGATAASSWSLRAHDGAPVVVPLHWEELDELPAGAMFGLERARQLALDPARDPWSGFHDLKQKLPSFRF